MLPNSDMAPPIGEQFHKGVDKGGARGAEAPPVLRFVLTNNIVVPCILSWESIRTFA